jgi:hypothetical protein
VLDTYFRPIPGQEFIEPAHRMALGHALQDVPEIGEGLHVVELCGGDEGTNGGPSLSAAIGAGEQMVLAPQRNLSVILPISGRRWKSIIGGTRSLAVVLGFAAASNVILAALPTSRRRPAW